ncbi:hypothetical protein ES703_22437 [subsurface metagenome]
MGSHSDISQIKGDKMKLDKAIKQLIDLERQPVISHWTDSRDAIKLGIEAMKAWERWRNCFPPKNKRLLPGETDEAPRLPHFHQPALVDKDKRSTK